MRIFISFLFAACLLSGCATQHQRASVAGGGEDTGDGVALGIGLLPVAVATSPIWVTGWGIRCISEIGDTRIYIPPGKTKKEVFREIDAVGKHGSSTHFRDGDEFYRAAVGGKIFYARFHDGITVEYDK
jgi:hypothetical protein